MARFTEYEKKLMPYLQAMPDIFRYVIVTKGILFAMMFLFGGMAKALLSSVGRVAVRLIHKHNMEDECVLISLKYDLINYIETKYPDMQTGFLTFVSFGNAAGLNCDYLGLEVESATAYKVDSIHKEGKKVLVWTVNEKSVQRHFLSSEVDGIITDNIRQAVSVKEKLESRSDFARMLDRVRIILASTM